LDPFRGSFSSVSTPIFATKAAFFSISQILHFFLCIIPDFCDFSSLRTIFCKFCENFADFHTRQQILQSLVKFQRIFPRISQNFRNFGTSDAKIGIFQRNLRKFAKKKQNFVAKLLKFCMKKMYALNVFGGKVLR
jgi:hypothetical protein